ncbi:hypothetical protein M2401_005302 [Pseudomonas sp. JUb42]|jgi:hypothetical protein|nr:hypothetical protein [Pseudomonas sp. JUb42]
MQTLGLLTEWVVSIWTISHVDAVTQAQRAFYVREAERL